MAKKKIKLLTRKKANWAENRDVTLRGERLSAPLSVAAYYEKSIDRLVKDLYKKLLSGVNNALKTGDVIYAEDASLVSKMRMLLNGLEREFSKEFGAKADRLSKRVISRINKNSSSAVHSSLEKLSGGLSIKSSTITNDVGEVIKASVAENVGLIKSIPSQFLDQVRFDILNSITNPANAGIEDLQTKIHNLLDDRYKKVRNRARFIATDQTRKAYNRINAARLDNLGITEFEWIHSGGGKDPRKYHMDVLNGKVFSLKDPPIINPDTGERGLPGQLPWCRCTMRPVIKIGRSTGAS